MWGPTACAPPCCIHTNLWPTTGGLKPQPVVQLAHREAPHHCGGGGGNRRQLKVEDVLEMFSLPDGGSTTGPHLKRVKRQWDWGSAGHRGRPPARRSHTGRARRRTQGWPAAMGAAAESWAQPGTFCLHSAAKREWKLAKKICCWELSPLGDNSTAECFHISLSFCDIGVCFEQSFPFSSIKDITR